MTIRSAREAVGTARRSAARVRQVLDERASMKQRFDALIGDVEEANIEHQDGISDQVAETIHALSESLPEPVPRAVRRARTGRRLHAALLDWQALVLDRVAPQRASYADRYD